MTTNDLQLAEKTVHLPGFNGEVLIITVMFGARPVYRAGIFGEQPDKRRLLQAMIDMLEDSRATELAIAA